MKAVYKYELSPGENVLVMPVGAEVLTVQLQRDRACLWAVVDTNETATEKRGFIIAGTGHQLPDDPLRYISTIQLYGGSLVFHVFEVSQ